MRAMARASASPMRAALLISAGWLILAGEERLARPKGLKGEAQPSGGGFAVRFHLHPWVSAAEAEDERSVALQLPNRESWILTARHADHRASRRACSSPMSGDRAAARRSCSQAASRKSAR